MLKRNLPSQTQRMIGVSVIAVVSLGVCAAAWSAQPAHVVFSKAPNIARADAAPFVEPPVTDRSLLLGGASQAAGQAASVEYAKADVADDRDADAASDENDAADDETGSDSAVLSDQDRAEIAAAGRLSSAERARIRAEIRQAMAESRVAIAQARVAARAAEAESMRAAVTAREAQSPAMQAEIRAMTAAAAQMARDTHMSAAEREAMRAEMRTHAQRIRELAHHSCPRDRAEHESHSDADHQND